MISLNGDVISLSEAVFRSRLNIKTLFSGNMDSNYKDNAVVKPSYIFNDNTSNDKTASLY